MAGPHIREAYNAKARGSTAGGSRKKGKPKKKNKAEQNEEEIDPNAAMIAPKTEESREMERKEKMLQEVCDRLDMPRMSTF